MFKKILFIIIICIGLLFAGKNFIFKAYITGRIKKEFGAAVSLQKATLNFKEINLSNLEIFAPDFSLKLKDAKFEFEFLRFFELKGLTCNVEGLYLKTKEFEKFKNSLKEASVGIFDKKDSKAGTGGAIPITLNLENLDFSIQGAKGLNFRSQFSFSGALEGKKIKKINNIDIVDLNFKNPPLEFDLTFYKESAGKYKLTVSSLKFRQNETENIRATVSIDQDVIFIEKVYSDLLGPRSLVSGSINFSTFDNFCLSLNLYNSSFGGILKLAGIQKDLNFDGEFDGGIAACLEQFKLAHIDGDLSNFSGGAINIKKEASIGFLKRYLDESSYEVMIDNLKNYAYNKGQIKVSKPNSTIRIVLDFSSQELGKRTITVNLKKFGGVE